VPAESERLRRRISGRDRWFLLLIAVAALVATPSAVLLSRHGSHSSPDPNCVTVLRASIMGGATYKYCGASAIAACKQFAARDKGVAAQCEARGLSRPRPAR
jgi:hypothetical protein